VNGQATTRASIVRPEFGPDVAAAGREVLHWVDVVEAAAAARGIVVDEETAIGVGCVFMFRARGIANGHPMALLALVTEMAGYAGLTLDEILAVGVA
jgi:hypothetical protein